MSIEDIVEITLTQIDSLPRVTSDWTPIASLHAGYRDQGPGLRTFDGPEFRVMRHAPLEFRQFDGHPARDVMPLVEATAAALGLELSFLDGLLRVRRFRVQPPSWRPRAGADPRRDIAYLESRFLGRPVTSAVRQELTRTAYSMGYRAELDEDGTLQVSPIGVAPGFTWADFERMAARLGFFVHQGEDPNTVVATWANPEHRPAMETIMQLYSDLREHLPAGAELLLVDPDSPPSHIGCRSVAQPSPAPKPKRQRKPRGEARVYRPKRPPARRLELTPNPRPRHAGGPAAAGPERSYLELEACAWCRDPDSSLAPMT